MQKDFIYFDLVKIINLMPIPLFNSIASWFLKKRIHQIELFKKYPLEVQEEVLHQLISTAAKTEIGLKNDFDSIKNYTDFRDRLPLVSYEDIEPQIQRCRNGEQNIFWPTPIKWFAKSSGTTNSKSKFIPVSNEAIEGCHYEAGKDMLSIYYNNNPDSQLLGGKNLRLGGSSEIYENNNSYFGDLSAIMIDNLPFWAELSSTPSQKTSLMSEWETKMEAIVSESINERVTGLLGVPSWMFVLLQNILKKTAKNNIHEVWPNAEVYFHGGVSFNPYRNLYQKLFPKDSFQFYEIYNASEGFFAIQDRNNSSDLLLMLDYGIFYEFIPMDRYTGSQKDPTMTLSEVKTNINYAVVISTNSGLWRYKIGDTIRFTDLNPYRIQITGRTKHNINVFGEELIIDNAERALTQAAKETDSIVLDYTAGPVFMEDNPNTKGGHEWMIEFKVPPKNLSDFTQLLDHRLKELNSDYEAKRYKDMTLTLPKVHLAKEGLFYRWLEKKNKLGGQHKVPRLSNSRNLVEELIEMNI